MTLGNSRKIYEKEKVLDKVKVENKRDENTKWEI